MSDWSHEPTSPLEDLAAAGELFRPRRFGTTMRRCMACGARVDPRDAVYVRGLPFCTDLCAERYPEVYEALAGAVTTTLFGGDTE